MFSMILSVLIEEYLRRSNRFFDFTSADKPSRRPFMQNLRDEALDEFDNAWYYQKILYEIKDHVKNAEEIADNIMKRLQKCSKYSKSIVFMIELAELLLNEEINSTELENIKYDLKWFKIDHLKKNCRKLKRKIYP